MATDTKKVRRDAFVKGVRPDTNSTEEVVLLQGYIGDSDLEGHIRVYFNPVLEDFIDLPEKDILYTNPIESTEDPLGGSRIWTKKTTVFTTGDPRNVNRIKSSFLEGDLIKAFGEYGIGRQVGNVGDNSTESPSCYRACYQPSFFRTCFKLITANPSCRTCQRTCLFPCTIAVQQTVVCEVKFRKFNPNVTTNQGLDYTGGFDPYRTQNFGY